MIFRCEKIKKSASYFFGCHSSCVPNSLQNYTIFRNNIVYLQANMPGFLQKMELKGWLALFGASLAVFALNVYLWTRVLGWELPKTSVLRRENAALTMKAGLLNGDLQECSDRLDALEIRDEDIYRSIFGLNSIPSQVRDAGLIGQSRYDELFEKDRGGSVYSLRRRCDMLEKKAFVQSRSFDEIELMLHHADNMATSIPAICPLVPDPSEIHISSPFGYRAHPVLGTQIFHRGIDFAVDPGTPVFATGDAVVESVKVEMEGYGRQVVLDHGFGYKTRYAHLKTILVTEGMSVKRGERIATSGNSGLTSGPHLHYEVIYKGGNVNPYHYFDRDMPLEQYRSMLPDNGGKGAEFYIHPMHLKKIRGGKK